MQRCGWMQLRRDMLDFQSKLLHDCRALRRPVWRRALHCEHTCAHRWPCLAALAGRRQRCGWMHLRRDTLGLQSKLHDCRALRRPV